MVAITPAILNGKDFAVLDGIPNDEYHGWDWAYSASMLKTLVTHTPAHFFAKYLDPERDPKQTKEEWSLGTVFHSLVLEPELDAGREFILHEELDRRTKVGKARWSELLDQAHAEGKQLLSQEGWNTAHKMALAARKMPLINEAFTGGRAEITILWRDPGTGLILKARPDYIKANMVVDLKSAISAHPDDAARAMYNWRYDIQNVHYVEGYKLAYGEPDGFIFVMMEKARPYAAAPYILDNETLALARQARAKALEILVGCLESGQWPGYSQDVQVIGVPQWAKRQIKESLNDD